MEVRPGYTPTDIGVVPKDWETPAIIDVAPKIIDYRGRTPRKLGMDWGGGDIPALSARNVKMGFIDFDAECNLGSESLYKRWMTNGDASRNDIVFTTEAPLGNVALIPDDQRYILSQRTILLKTDSARVYSPFLFQLMRSDRFQQLLAENASGSTAQGIQRKRFETLRIACPPVVEQHAIAAALSDLDALLAGLDRLIAKKRDLKQAAMQNLLTGQTRLPGFQGEWGSTALRKAVVTPITDGPHLTPQFLLTGVPFLSVNNLVDHRLDFSTLRYISMEDHANFSKKCKPRRGDILFGKAASVGMVALIETDMELNIWSPLALIRVTGRMNERFVFYALQTHHIAKQIKLMTNASSQGNIGMSDIGMLEIPVPSISEQEAIAAVLSDMDAELTALDARRDKTRALKRGMMQELLTGRTRLV